MIKTLFLLLLAVSVSSANQDHPGKFSVSVSNSGHTSEIRRTYANEYPGGRLHLMEDRNGSFESPAADSGTVRWVYTDPAGIAERCAVSGNGRYNVTGWMLNNHRISVFRNNDPVPLWEYPTVREIIPTMWLSRTQEELLQQVQTSIFCSLTIQALSLSSILT